MHLYMFVCVQRVHAHVHMGKLKASSGAEKLQRLTLPCLCKMEIAKIYIDIF